MKERSKKPCVTTNIVSVNDTRQAETEVTDRRPVRPVRPVCEEQKINFERSQAQIKLSMKKSNDSILAVRKSLAAVDAYYREFYEKDVLPSPDEDWQWTPAKSA